MTKKKIIKRSVPKAKTKKTAKKVMVKKMPQKKVTKKNKTPLKPLVVVDDGRAFWLHQGAVLKDLLGLHDALRVITDEQFKHHVNAMKNDFAAWVEAVLGDKKAASEMRKALTIGAMTRSVEKALAQYQN